MERLGAHDRAAPHAAIQSEDVPSNRTSDSATMKSDVIGDFQEPYGAVLGVGMFYLQCDPSGADRQVSRRTRPRAIDKSYGPDFLNPKDPRGTLLNVEAGTFSAS
jgi:hypothetical protein